MGFQLFTGFPLFHKQGFPLLPQHTLLLYDKISRLDSDLQVVGERQYLADEETVFCELTSRWHGIVEWRGAGSWCWLDISSICLGPPRPCQIAKSQRPPAHALQAIIFPLIWKISGEGCSWEGFQDWPQKDRNCMRYKLRVTQSMQTFQRPNNCNVLHFGINLRCVHL